MLDKPMTDAAREIVFTRHEGRRGIAWLQESYALFRRAKLRWIVMVVAYFFLLGVIELVPFAGWLVVILKPVFGVGFLAAAWSHERGIPPSPRHLFHGFRSNLKALLPLGVVLLCGILLAVGATALVDGGQLVDLLLHPAPPDLDQNAAARRFSETLVQPRVQLGMLFGAACALPTILALWWAPALVVFQDAETTTALRMSLRACLANWRPLLQYGIVAFFFGAIVPSMLVLVVAFVVPASLSPEVPATVLALYSWCYIAVLQISDYVSYREVFHAGETVAGIERKPPA
jgi:hypothetical protein